MKIQKQEAKVLLKVMVPFSTKKFIKDTAKKAGVSEAVVARSLLETIIDKLK